MKRFWLFALVSVFGGLGAALGSILGNAAGPIGLRVGAVAGGAIAIALAVQLGARAGLVPPARVRHTTLGGLGGFALAIVVALNTMASPVGPVLSAALIGLGAVFGASSAGTPRQS
jgi:hypothetical protein